jgi:hypothetical protein
MGQVRSKSSVHYKLEKETLVETFFEVKVMRMGREAKSIK